MATTPHDYYLSVMGIDRWQRRSYVGARAVVRQPQKAKVLRAKASLDIKPKVPSKTPKVTALPAISLVFFVCEDLFLVDSLPITNGNERALDESKKFAYDLMVALGRRPKARENFGIHLHIDPRKMPGLDNQTAIDHLCTSFANKQFASLATIDEPKLLLMGEGAATRLAQADFQQHLAATVPCPSLATQAYLFQSLDWYMAVAERKAELWQQIRHLYKPTSSQGG